MTPARRDGGQRCRTKIVPVDLESLRPVVVELGYGEVLLVVRWRGRWLGRVPLPASPRITPSAQRAAIAHRLGDTVWNEALRSLLSPWLPHEAAGPRSGESELAVVVCTRNRPHELRRCLDSLVALASRPREIVVVDNAPADDRTRRVCAGYPVRYVVESHPGLARAKNRGLLESDTELVAYIDDDSVADSHWLDGVELEFRDPLVSAVTGWTAPYELETHAQCWFEHGGGFVVGAQRRVFDRGSRAPMVPGACTGGNAVFRSSALSQIGLFREDLGAGTPAAAGEDTHAFSRLVAAGYRVVSDPARVVWHGHRRRQGDLRRQLFNYGVGASSYLAVALLAHREPTSLRILASWWLRRFPSDLARSLIPGGNRRPLGLVLAEAGGFFIGPLALYRSSRSRRSIPPLRPSRRPAAPAGPRVVVGGECPSASVVVTCDGRAARLLDVLQALARQSLPPERVEIVLALPRKLHAEATALAGRAGVSSRVRLAEVRGRTPAALNSALGLAREPIVLFLDERLVPDSSLLARHVRAHAENPGDVAVLGYSPPAPSSGSPLWDQRQRADEEDFFRRLRQAAHQWSFVDFRSGNASLPRSSLAGVGGFDTRLSGRRADWELALRLLKRGVKFVHDADARALHRLDGSLDEALCRRRIEAGDDLLITGKHLSASGLLPLSRVDLPRRAWRSVLLRSWPSELTVEVGLALLSLYESLNLRRQWDDLVDRLMEWSYAVGLAQSAASSPGSAPPGDVRDEPASEVLSLALDDRKLYGGAAGVGPSEFALTWSGSPVHVLRAVEPEEQWDWERIHQRIVASAPASLRRALLAGLLGPADQHMGEGATRGRHMPGSKPRTVTGSGRES